MIKTQAMQILLVEDDEQQRLLLKGILEKADFSVFDADSCESAILILQRQQVNIIFSDWKLPNLSGLDLLNYVRKNLPHLGFVMATAHGTINHAVEAMQAGADDYLAKPFQRQELLLSIEKAYRAYTLRSQNKSLSEALNNQQQLVDLVSVSDSMEAVKNRIGKVANSEATVLITGESGTGKELVARSIHQLSSRHQHRFVAINCGAIPQDLAEAELFGAKKGAYTGANSDKIGKLAFADNGTLFLDEIAELPLLLQAKLLRFLQEGTITPLGDNKEQQLNVRVVTATHKNIAEMVQQGEFREDLYYRLNIVPIDIPPLRNRPDDLHLLADVFYKQKCLQYDVQYEPFTKDLVDALLSYDWPGNVRELANRIERFVLLGEQSELVPNRLAQSSLAKHKDFILPDEGIDIEALEKSLLAQALNKTAGNRTKAAKLVQMSYKTFLYRLEKHDLV
jgi:DNA-binding NtrC family response regulator